jgi:hypothetical protein
VAGRFFAMAPVDEWRIISEVAAGRKVIFLQAAPLYMDYP